MTKMKPKVKALWLDALRSSKYKQGIGNLRNNKDEFCCLGVLCDLYAKTQKKKGWSNKHDEYRYFFGDTNIVYNVLPKKVQIWSGINSALGEYGNGGLYIDNDTKKKSFEEIAQIIEENF